MTNDPLNDIERWDLYKSYGQFNLSFESVIHECRGLLTSLIRISYNYYEEEDDNENELPEVEQDRLIKVLLQHMPAMEIVESCRACFVDFFSRQKIKNGNYSFLWWDSETLTLSDNEYKQSVEVFKRCSELVKLRNIIIHSHYDQTIFSLNDGSQLKGRKDFKTKDGYEERRYKYSVGYFEKINRQIEDLYRYILQIRYSLYPSVDGNNHQIEFSELSAINFEPPLD